LNSLLNLRTGHGFFSKKRVGKKALFFVHAVKAEKSIASKLKSTVVRDANIAFTISRIDGFNGFGSLTRSGSGLLSSLRWSFLPER
jgi:lysozyme family protein